MPTRCVREGEGAHGGEEGGRECAQPPSPCVRERVLKREVRTTQTLSVVFIFEVRYRAELGQAFVWLRPWPLKRRPASENASIFRGVVNLF